MTNNEFIEEIKSDYITPVKLDHAILVPSVSQTVILLNNMYSLEDCKITLTNPMGQTTTLAADKDISASFTPSETGIYTIRYTGTIHLDANHYEDASNFKIAFSIAVVPNYEPLPKWNIRSVIDRVLNLAEPHLQSVSPRYKLDPAQAADLEKIDAPEFAFTQNTLREILDQIGGFIHGIPRLIKGGSGKYDTIHYDMLGGMDEAEISKINRHYITEIHSQTIEDYVTELDSTVENLVNTLGNGDGLITEPYVGGFQTVRSEETYGRIEDGNMIIATSLPIYSIQKLEVIDTKGKVGDITAYVFEGSDYGRLSSFDGAYPTSKAYAIYYTLGQNNIKGLYYKSPHVMQGRDGEYSITNIIKAVTGTDVEGDYPKLAFRITYTPIFSARILQHKPYVEEGALKRSLVYNQGANLVETRFYGENLKGTVARMGNVEFSRTYREPDLSLLPKIGQIYKYDGDEYYISSIAVAVYPRSVDFMVGMSKDFNRLSQYIGVNSEWRAYEVSEKKAYKRDTAYADYAVITFDDNYTGDGKSLLKNAGQQAIVDSFTVNSTQSHVPLGVAVVDLFHTDADEAQVTVTLPVISTAFGNTMTFMFGMQDNYSAGRQSIKQNDDGKVTGYWQTDVQYPDYYGRLKSMSFYLGGAGNYNSEAGFDVPRGDYGGPLLRDFAYIGTDADDALIVDKDGNEVLRMNYNIGFVTTSKDIIIGSGMARRNYLVGKDQEHYCALYALSKPLGRFDTHIDLSTSKMLVRFDELSDLTPALVNPNTPQSKISFGDGNVLSNDDGVAWAIADEMTGELMFGRNEPTNEPFRLPYIAFTHKLP